MSKFEDFKKTAIKAGQATVVTGMLAGSLFGGKSGEIRSIKTDMSPVTTVSTEHESTKVSPVSTVKAEQPIKEMMWLDESNMIINGEILSNEDAYAKYPKQAANIKNFAEACLHEKELELNPIDQIPANKWKHLSPEMEKEVADRLQHFDINDYLPRENDEPTLEK